MKLTSLCLIDLNSFTHKFYKYLHDNKTPVQYHQVNVPVSQVWQIYFHHLELKICFFWFIYIWNFRTPWRLWYNVQYIPVYTKMYRGQTIYIKKEDLAEFTKFVGPVRHMHDQQIWLRTVIWFTFCNKKLMRTDIQGCHFQLIANENHRLISHFESVTF